MSVFFLILDIHSIFPVIRLSMLITIKIKFIKPAGVKNPIRTRFHMDPTYSNDIIIDSVIIQYNSGKEISYTAENYFSNIYWLGSNIKNITYAANSAIITFNENIKDESYIELGTDLRFYRYNHYFYNNGSNVFFNFLDINI
jgi:hypothetical protein